MTKIGFKGLTRIALLAGSFALVAGSASATTLLNNCSSPSLGWQIAASTTSGSIGCTLSAAQITTLSAAGTTITGVQLVVETDYSGGNLGSVNTMQTIYSSSAMAAADTLTSTSSPGTGPSGAYSSSLGASIYAPGGASYFIENLTISQSAIPGTITVNYTSSVTGGAVQSISGQVYELITYTTTSGVPEPTTFVLMGAGLGLIGMLRRKTARR